MGVVPGGIETEKQPPMTVPLRHFLVGIGLALAGAGVGVANALGVAPGLAGLAHVHLLLVGWVCVTIMGAMTQFVPVWSGVDLYSRRLAVLQLWLVALGVTGFATALLAGAIGVLPAFGAAMLLGFWTFAYNLGRTLAGVDAPDVTERHFGLALCFFVLATSLGLVLAVDLVVPAVPFARTDVVAAHATLAVFGAVLTTVFGALYQLATMFTQSDLRGIDHWLRRFEEVGYPIGVLSLAGGRLFSMAGLATAGGLLVAGSVFAVGVVLARRLLDSTVDWTPMLARYAVVAVAMVAWASSAALAWVDSPLGLATLFGAAGGGHLLAFGVVGFVVLGTLYHVVPFVVWVHQYSDQLGLADVPMIDDLYDDRIARTDLVATVAGGGCLVAAESLVLPRVVTLAGGSLATLGLVLFAANVALVLRRHSPHSLVGTLFDRRRAVGEDGPAE